MEPYTVDNAHRDRDTEVQRLAAQARLSWKKEARTLSLFGLRDGMSVLELGSGPGFITEMLLKMLPHSTITCVEIDSSLIQDAKQYLPEEDRVHFVEASVTETGLPDNSFDFAYARLLYQHLSDPIKASREIWRILKPGGKLVIYDIDDEIFGIIDPPVPEWSIVVEKMGKIQEARGGNRRIGRLLWRILKEAGFQNLDLEMIATHTDDLGIEAFLPQLDPDRLVPLIQAGMISKEEIDRIRNSRRKFLNSPSPYILTLSMMVCGEKQLGGK